MAKGRFITVEGTDGSGKTTQFRLMGDYLISRGFDIVTVREPGGTHIGEKIRRIILDPENKEMNDMTELLLYTASRAQLSQEVIRPALEAGKLVLCDRFVDSNVAYQGYGRGLPLEMIHSVNRQVTGGLVPDLTIFFDLAPEHALKRLKGESDRLEKQSIEFHNRVYEGYRTISRQNPDRVRRINCNRGIDVIFEDVKKILDWEVSL